MKIDMRRSMIIDRRRRLVRREMTTIMTEWLLYEQDVLDYEIGLYSHGKI
jgi:hypothetical protein